MATYLEIYPESISSGEGLISALSKLDSIPWNTMTTEQIQDVERLYGVRSGCKTLSAGITVATNDARAKILATLFARKWSRLWKDFDSEYDPLAAYMVIETGNKNKDIRNDDTIDYGKTVTESGTDTGTVENMANDLNQNRDYLYGFNSVEAAPSGESNNTVTSTGREIRDLKTSRSLANEGQDVRATSGNEKEDYSLTKKGNIGYTTPQELLREDFELWKVPFFNLVFEDIDSFITILVYD